VLFTAVVLADLGYVLAAKDGSTAPTVDELDPGQAVGALATAALGLALAWLRPCNAVGWLLSLSGLALAVCNVGQAYGGRALTSDPELPLGAASLSLSAPLWLAAVFIPVSVLLVRYPSGTIVGRWPRRFDRAAIVGYVLLYVAYAGSPSSVTDEVPGHLPPVVLPEVVGATLGGAGLFLLLAGSMLIVADAVRRALRSSPQERAPLLLLLTTAVTAAVVIFVGPNVAGGQVAYVAVLAAIGVGVLRYRALGIELVVRRTVISVLLTGLVLAVFVGVTSGLAGLVPTGPGAQIVAASLIALGLMPVRERLQRLVDRLLYGDRDDPAATLRKLGSSMDQVPADGLLLAVTANLAESLHLAGAEIVDPAGSVLASWGDPTGRGGVVPLTFAGADLGTLRLGSRRGEEALGKADRHLLEAVVPMIAAVVHAERLTDELRAERNRVVGATEAERTRLRQDLHDGLGPSLTGIGLGLEAAGNSPMAAEPATAELLRRLRLEVAGSLEEIRRIIEDLRPVSLDGADLGTALRRRISAAADSGLVTRLEVQPDLPPLTAVLETALFRIADEALTNVVRHAQARSCTVRLTVADSALLTVVDDGVGFAGPRPGGVGLGSMQERAERLGGRLSVERRTPGTIVSAELPLDQAVVSA
jgi:signal transduction histidine kinase